MFRKTGENLRTIYVFVFLNIAFFFLEYQDEKRFATFFSFDAASVKAGQVWRILTYQFTQAGQGWLFFPKPVVLFFTLLILYLMGSAVEEHWGTVHFLGLFLTSTLATAALAAGLGIPLLGSFFVNYTLLFVYASMFPDQTFFVFAVIPIRVRWLAYVAVAILVWGAVMGGSTNIAVLGGALAGYAYYLLLRGPVRVPRKLPVVAKKEEPAAPDMTGVRNAARFVAIKRAVATQNEEEIERLIAQCERETVAGVNTCPPADFKPENADGYCIRCEGFAECSARYMRLNRTAGTAAAPSAGAPSVEAPA